MISIRQTGNSGWGCLILGALTAIVTYFILKGLFVLLAWAALPLFVLALIIEWRAVADTGKELWGSIQRNPTGWLILTALTYIGVQNTGIPFLDDIGRWVVNALMMAGFPLLALFLFLRALSYRKLLQFRQAMQNGPTGPAVEEEYVEYEEIESRPKNAPAEPEDTPGPLEPPQKESPGKPNPYDDIFGG